ncbi:MAG: hypothetical protein AAF138_03230 [Planctomycetota bacterium]
MGRARDAIAETTRAERAQFFERSAVVVGLAVFASSFFLGVFGGWTSEILGWEAAAISFRATLWLVSHEAWQGPRDADWFSDVWVSLAWLGNAAWLAALLRRYAVGPMRRKTGRALAVVATLTAAISLAGMMFELADWGAAYWFWASSNVLAAVIAWRGSARPVPFGACVRCGYELDGLPICPECGAEASAL